MDTAVDKKLPGDRDSASIFSMVIGHKLSHGPSDDFYLRFRMDFSSNDIQTEAPEFVNLGLPTINTSNKLGVLGFTATRIRSPTDGSHWSVLDHIFGKATAVKMSAPRSDQDYSYKLVLKFEGKIGNLSVKIF